MTHLYNMWVPHALHLLNDAGEVLRTLSPHHTIPSLVHVTERIDEVAGVQLFRRVAVRCVGLPPVKDDKVLIVPAEVALALGDRTDLVHPQSIVISENGGVVGIKGLLAGRGMQRRYHCRSGLCLDFEACDGGGLTESRDVLLMQARTAVAAAVETGATKTMIAHAMGIALPSLTNVLKSRRAASPDYLKKIIGAANRLSG